MVSRIRREGLYTKDGHPTKIGHLYIHKTLYLIYKHLGLYDEKYEKECVKPTDKDKPITDHVKSVFRLCEVIREAIGGSSL